MEYISEQIKKVLEIREREVLNINICYPKFSVKKADKFYAKIAESFLHFCESRLYKSAAEKFLLFGDEFQIFSANMNFEVKKENELVKIYLDADINGEKNRGIHTWNFACFSGELVKPVKKIKKFKKIKK